MSVKPLLVILTVLSTILRVYTQSSQDLLEQIAEKYQAMEAFSVQFTYEMHHPQLNITDSFTGKAFVQDTMYVLDLQTQQILSNGEALWTYIQESQEVTITSIDEESELNIQNLLNMYKGNFDSRLLSEEGISRRIELVSKQKDSPLFKAQLLVDTEDMLLQEAKLFYKDGSRFTYTMYDLKIEKAQPKSYFSFQVTEQQTVIDLR